MFGWHSSPLWKRNGTFTANAYGFLCPSPAHGKFSLNTISISVCVCVCMYAFEHVCMCGYAYTCGSQRTALNFIPREMSHWVSQFPGAWQGKLTSQESLGVPLPPTSHYWDCRHTNILYVFLASNSGPYVYWRPISLVFHFLFFIYLGTQGTNWPD